MYSGLLKNVNSAAPFPATLIQQIGSGAMSLYLKKIHLGLILDLQKTCKDNLYFNHFNCEI